MFLLFKQFFLDLIDDAMKKWRGLRDTFRKEVKKLKLQRRKLQRNISPRNDSDNCDSEEAVHTGGGSD